MKPIKGTIKFVDKIEIEVRRKDGSIKSKHTINDGIFHRLLCKLGIRHNSMTNIGFAQVAAFLLADIDVDHSVYTNCNWLSIGIGVVAADPTDTDLGTPKGIRQAAVGTRVTTGGITNNTAQLVASFSHAIDATLTGVDAITEVGMFWHVSAASSMLLRQVYSPSDNCDWDQGDSMQVTVKVQVKQGA